MSPFMQYDMHRNGKRCCDEENGKKDKRFEIGKPFFDKQGI